MTTERTDNFYLKSKVCFFEDACSHRVAIGDGMCWRNELKAWAFTKKYQTAFAIRNVNLSAFKIETRLKLW